MSDAPQYKTTYRNAERVKDWVHNDTFPILAETDDGILIHTGDDTAPQTDDVDILQLQDDVELVAWESLKAGQRYSAE